MAKQWVMTPARRAYYSSKKKMKGSGVARAKRVWKSEYRQRRAVGMSKKQSREEAYSATLATKTGKAVRMARAYAVGSMKADGRTIRRALNYMALKSSIIPAFKSKKYVETGRSGIGPKSSPGPSSISTVRRGWKM